MFERKNTAIQNAVSGAIAGISTRLVVSPLDVIKIRIQLETKKTSIFNSFQTIIKEEGIRGFFKGNLSAEYLYITYSATQFLTFYEIDKQLEDSILNRSSRSFISGASAGIIATVTTYPLDLLRTRFAAQHQSNVYSSLIQAITQIKQKEGFSGFYRGVIPAAVQVTPYMGIMFSSNSFLKDKVKVLDKTEGIKNALDFICGGLSGIISKTAVMPFDLIRKRLQVQGPTLNHYGSSIPKAPSSSFILTGIYIARTEGILALYKGLTMALIKAAPSSAITFFVFGICSRYFNKN